MNKKSSGSAYLMVIFVSIPILLILFVALATSANSRNSTAHHGTAFGLYELAHSANVLAIAAFEDAYKELRLEAHLSVLQTYFDFMQMPVPQSLSLPASYMCTFRRQLTPLIKTKLQEHFILQGSSLQRPIELQVGQISFSGVSTIVFLENGATFTTTVSKSPSGRSSVSVRGRLVWPEEAEKKIYLGENFEIKNLDYFTPWVVELIRR